MIAVRLVLGIGDPTPQDWTGRVELDEGEVVGIEGLRFRDGDTITGRDAWKTSSRLIRKATKKAAAKAKRQAAKAKKNAAAEIAQRAGAVPRATGPSTTGATVTPNGVVLVPQKCGGSDPLGRHPAREILRAHRSACRRRGRVAIG